jgi:hypothetical protein
MADLDPQSAAKRENDAASDEAEDKDDDIPERIPLPETNNPDPLNNLVKAVPDGFVIVLN